MELRIEGLDELQEYLASLLEKLAEPWGPELGEVLEEARRFAASISPVVSGSYRAAHRVVVGKMQATLSIDPAARNTRTGVPVTRYAAEVEARHHVYGQTAAFTHRLVAQGDIGERLLQ